MTKYCGDTCSKKAYKTRKRREKIQATLTNDMQQQKEVVVSHNLKDVNNKDFLSVTEASLLIGVSITKKIKTNTVRIYVLAV